MGAGNIDFLLVSSSRLVGLSSAPIDFISRIPDDAPIMGEARCAIEKLKNGRAAGPDGIQPELLKCAELPTRTALHELIA